MKKYSLLLLIAMVVAPCFGTSLPLPKAEATDCNRKEDRPKSKLRPSKGMDDLQNARLVYAKSNENAALKQKIVSPSQTLHTAEVHVLTEHSSSAQALGIASEEKSLSVILSPSPDVSVSPTDSISPSPSLSRLLALGSPTLTTSRSPSINTPVLKITSGSKLDKLQQLIWALPTTVAAKETQPITDFYQRIQDESNKEYAYAQHMYKDFENTVTAFFATMRTCMNDDRLWLGKKPAAILCNDLKDATKSPFSPFVQKITLNNQRVRHIGDLHGDLHTLVNILIDMFFKGQISDELVLSNGMNIMLHGDLGDRGLYSIETIVLAMTLKIINPEHVFILRGNHESWVMNLDATTGLTRELCKLDIATTKHTAPQLQDAFQPVFEAIYNLLPVALIINNEILCCHGAPDWRHNPTTLQADKRPIAFECLTQENYNPAWITSKLSDQSLWNLAYNLSEELFSNPGTDASIMARSIANHTDTIAAAYSTIAQELQKVVDASQPTSSTTKEESSNTQEATQHAEKTAYTMAHQKLLAAINTCSTLKEHLLQYAQQAAYDVNPATILDFFEDLEQINNNIADKADATLQAASDYTENQKQIEVIRQELANINCRICKILGQDLAPWMETLRAIQTLQEVFVLVMRQPTHWSSIFEERGIVAENCADTLGAESTFGQLFFNHISDTSATFFPDELQYLWGDVIVQDANRTFISDKTYKAQERFGQTRPAFGKKILQEILSKQHFHCVIRGHQQFDAMRKTLDDNKGITSLWDCKASFANAQRYPLEDGCIYTLDAAKWPFQGAIKHTCDSSAVVTYGSTRDTCTIQNEIIEAPTDDENQEPTTGLITINEDQECIRQAQGSDATHQEDQATGDAPTIAVTTIPAVNTTAPSVAVAAEEKALVRS